MPPTSRERTPCIVPGCARTRGEQPIDKFDEWCCGKHWPAVPKQMRRVLARLHRRERKYGWSSVLWNAERRIWQRIKRAAIEKAMGI